MIFKKKKSEFLIYLIYTFDGNFRDKTWNSKTECVTIKYEIKYTKIWV